MTVAWSQSQTEVEGLACQDIFMRKASAIQERLKQRGILVTNVDLHLLPENQHNDRIRLCIIGVENSQIEGGFTVIAEEIRSMERRMR